MARDIAALVARAVDGDRASIAKLISIVEAGGDDAVAAEAAVYPHTGRAYTIGLTGAPGAGKSSLTDALIRRMRAEDLEVGVLAIDPTSPYSGGAILGDRVRMQDHAFLLAPGAHVAFGNSAEPGDLKIREAMALAIEQEVPRERIAL
ncbi:MAG: hypothetical protein ACXV8Y_14205, partial [Acidimicrobiia bacterium]